MKTPKECLKLLHLENNRPDVSLTETIALIQSDARNSALDEANDAVNKIYNPFETNRDKNEGFKIMRSKSSDAIKNLKLKMKLDTSI